MPNRFGGEILENATSRDRGMLKMPNWKGALCDHCKQISLWYNGELIYPENPNLPPPNEDLDAEIKKDYNEAANIIEKSPKAAAALLRLAIQKLCEQLGESGENINRDIGELVKKRIACTNTASIRCCKSSGECICTSGTNRFE